MLGRNLRTLSIPAGVPADAVKENGVASAPALSEDSRAPSPSHRLARIVVLAFAGFIALLVLASAFLTDRNGDVDELMMYNPSYMVAHFGKLTFPSYTFHSFYNQPVIIHPPIHLGWIGLLEKAGFTWYYAEAIPAVFFLLLGILIIVVTAFPAPVKLGLLFSTGFLMAAGDDFVVLFGVRPEGEVYAAWWAGLLLLESGRLAGWNRTRLFFGAFLLTWASGVHYYACAAFVGVAVYIAWVLSDLGWTESKSRLMALIGGGCLFGVPYVTLYLGPHLQQILMFVRLSTGGAGIATAIRTHWSYYQWWAHADYIPALIRKPAGLGVPLAIFSTLVLGMVKPTRGIALAALPLQVFIFFFAAHKLPNYLVHEVALFAAAAGVGVLVACNWLWRRIPWPVLRESFATIAGASLICYLVIANPPLRAARFSTHPRVHEGDLARAAARQILGPHARVTGRDAGWYTSGADYWFDVERDMLQSEHYDPASYFSNFDAAVDYAHYSDHTQDGSISSWYADGILKLRGFYFGETNEELRLVFLSTHASPQVAGYAMRGGQLFRFEQQPSGNFQVVSAACPMTAQVERGNGINGWEQTFSAVEYLPHPAPGGPALIVTALFPRRSAEPAGWIHQACTEITSLTGDLTPVDKDALIRRLRREDTPMHFPRMLEELPGYQGVVLPEAMRAPKASVRLDGLVKLNEIRGTSSRTPVEHLPQIRIATPPSSGAFGAVIPLTRGELVTTPCWLQLRLRVVTGEIGIAAFGPHGIVARTQLAIVKSADPIDVALRTPGLRDVTSIIIFNESPLVGAKADVLDASVLVTPDDWERDEARLSSLK